MTITTARTTRHTGSAKHAVSARRNRVAELVVAGVLLGIATVGLVATTDAALAAPAAPAAVSSVQLPTE